MDPHQKFERRQLLIRMAGYIMAATILGAFVFATVRYVRGEDDTIDVLQSTISYLESVKHPTDTVIVHDTVALKTDTLWMKLPADTQGIRSTAKVNAEYNNDHSQIMISIQ